MIKSDCEVKSKRRIALSITQRINMAFIPAANKKAPGELALDRALSVEMTGSIPVGEHTHILAAAVLEDHTLAGLIVDLVSLPAGFGEVCRRGFMAVAE